MRTTFQAEGSKCASPKWERAGCMLGPKEGQGHGSMVRKEEQRGVFGIVTKFIGIV